MIYERREYKIDITHMWVNDDSSEVDILSRKGLKVILARTEFLDLQVIDVATILDTLMRTYDFETPRFKDIVLRPSNEGFVVMADFTYGYDGAPQRGWESVVFAVAETQS